MGRPRDTHSGSTLTEGPLGNLARWHRCPWQASLSILGPTSHQALGTGEPGRKGPWLHSHRKHPAQVMGRAASPARLCNTVLEAPSCQGLMENAGSTPGRERGACLEGRTLAGRGRSGREDGPGLIAGGDTEGSRHTGVFHAVGPGRARPGLLLEGCLMLPWQP